MKQIVTKGIVLGRTDFGEADRIVTILTPDNGKIRLVAKGVRRIKSKLAGGIELFSVSDITFIRGRSELGTLVSARLQKYYGGIVSDITRVQFGYDLIKLLNKVTEDEAEEDYFELLEQAFEALADVAISSEIIQAWFTARLLTLAGHAFNLRTATGDTALQEGAQYGFDFESMAFTQQEKGVFAGTDIKVLRLLFSGTKPSVLVQIGGLQSRIVKLLGLLQNAAALQLHP